MRRKFHIFIGILLLPLSNCGGAELDPYKVLGLRRSANTDQIKRAYRQKAKDTHPDRNPGRQKEAEEEFRNVAAAYELLSDDDRRANYDRGGRRDLDNWKTPNSPRYFQHGGRTFVVFNGRSFDGNFQRFERPSFQEGAHAYRAHPAVWIELLQQLFFFGIIAIGISFLFAKNSFESKQSPQHAARDTGSTPAADRPSRHISKFVHKQLLTRGKLSIICLPCRAGVGAEVWAPFDRIAATFHRDTKLVFCSIPLEDWRPFLSREFDVEFGPCLIVLSSAGTKGTAFRCGDPMSNVDEKGATSFLERLLDGQERLAVLDTSPPRTG